MKQEAKSIYEFKKGDIITRIEPMNLSGEEKEYSFVGKKFIFMGIANACIYLSKELDILSSMIIGKDNFTVQLPVDLASEGWAYYIDPEFINENDKIIFESENSILKKIEGAIEKDNFEEAELLKKRLQQLKNKNK